jgi:hypothetical protein
MSKTVLGIATALVLATGISAAYAEGWGSRGGWGGGATYTPRIDSEQARQRSRIEDGRRSGQLNRWEYERLSAQQDRISAMERRAKADGVVTPWERRAIREAQHGASRSIWHEKHDGDSRWTRWHRRWW